MKTLSELQTHYNSDSLTTADCWLVVCKDGTRFGFTDHPEDLSIDGDTYEGNVGFDRTATEVTNSLGADNHRLIGIIDSNRITVEDIQGRKFQGAWVWHFSVDYTNPSGTKDKHGFGFLGEIRLKGKIWEAEYTSLAVLLEREIGEVRTPYCRVALGSERCGVTLDPTAWTSVATVAVGDVIKNPTYDGRRHVCISAGVTSTVVPVFTSVIGSVTFDGTATWQCADAFFKHFSVVSVNTDRLSFEASVLGGVVSGWYQYGVCNFSTGDNAGQSMQVKLDSSAGLIEVLFEFPFSFAVGDEGWLTAGCNHKLKDAGDAVGSAYTGHCRSRYDNALRFQGDPESIGIDAIIAGDVE